MAPERFWGMPRPRPGRLCAARPRLPRSFAGEGYGRARAVTNPLVPAQVGVEVSGQDFAPFIGQMADIGEQRAPIAFAGADPGVGVVEIDLRGLAQLPHVG